MHGKTQYKDYNGVQGHSRSSRSVPIENPFAISYYWLIVTDILSRTVSELSQLIVQISDLCVFEPPFGGIRTTCHVHHGFIGKRIVDFLLVLIEVLLLGVTAESLWAKRWKNIDFAPMRSLWSKITKCSKGDCQSQWKTPIFGPSQLGNPLTDFDKIWNRWLRRRRDPSCQIGLLYI